MGFISKPMLFLVLHTEKLRHIWVAVTFSFQPHHLFSVCLLVFASYFYRLDNVCLGVVYAPVLPSLPMRDPLLKEA
jgi:hypothetical protein